MSILIKGMKMPKNCLLCPLQDFGVCQVLKTDVYSALGRRADDCPLVELPEKHGDLIDKKQTPMKPEEAIERIKEHIAIHQYNEPHAIRIAEALQMGIDALEKQIPKKPNKISAKDNDNLWHMYCPSCEHWIGIWNSRLKRGNMYNISNGNICSYCGQAIDLEEGD